MKTTSARDAELLPNLRARLERHFVTCGAALGAAAALMPAQDATADIVFYDIPDTQIPLNNTTGIYFNLETGAFSSDANAVPGWDINIYNPNRYYLLTYAPDSTGIVGFTNAPYRYADRLMSGDTIGNAASLLFGGITTMSYSGVGGYPPTGQWLGNVSGFLGIKFRLADASDVFGWMAVDVQDSVNARVTSFAYENSGGEITAGAIPEPSTTALSLLAAGAAGVACWRRRKAAQAA